MKTRRIAGAVFAWGLLFISSSSAATRYVNVSNATPGAPYLSWPLAATNIQSAVDAAASGDEILVAPGVYRLSGYAVTIPLYKALTLRSTQSRAAVIDARGLGIGLSIDGTNSVVEGFTVRNGVTDSYGGGISIGRRAVVRDCLVTSNRAYGGAGVVVFGEAAGAVVENCTIQSNLATYFGGGVILYSGVPALVRNCQILDNVASNFGGGVEFQGGGMLSNCWIARNRAVLENGGGVSLDFGGELVNSVVVGNQANTEGGGIYNFNGHVAHCTVVSNASALKGGGMHGSIATSWNNIVYFNAAPTNENISGSFSVLSNCCSMPDFGGSNFTNAPTFVNLAAQDFHLATASSCIDVGTILPDVAFDYDGHARPRVGTPAGPARVDVGAYEYGFHFNRIEMVSTNGARFEWDVQDRGIYLLDLATNAAADPGHMVWQSVGGGGYTNPGMPLGQFLVHTQTVTGSGPIPASAMFRLRISHYLAK